jgi:hypothetical protein
MASSVDSCAVSIMSGVEPEPDESQAAVMADCDIVLAVRLMHVLGRLVAGCCEELEALGLRPTASRYPRLTSSPTSHLLPA